MGAQTGWATVPAGGTETASGPGHRGEQTCSSGLEEPAFSPGSGAAGVDGEDAGYGSA